MHHGRQHMDNFRKRPRTFSDHTVFFLLFKGESAEHSDEEKRGLAKGEVNDWNGGSYAIFLLLKARRRGLASWLILFFFLSERYGLMGIGLSQVHQSACHGIIARPEDFPPLGVQFFFTGGQFTFG